MLAFALSLTHSVYDCTHHDACILTLTVSLTCDCTRHYVCPRPFTTIFTSPPQSLILLHLHSPACSHVLTLSPTHSVCNHMYGWPSPSHSLTTLFAIVLTAMLALTLSLTHSLYATYDCTYYRVCLPSSSHVHSLLVITLTIILVFTIKNEKRGWSGEGVWW